MSPKKPAQTAVRTVSSPFASARRCASKAMESLFGARGAAESGPAPKTTKTKKEAPMKSKVSSSRVAEIASRILRGKPYSEREAKAVAASVVAQSKPTKTAKRKR